MPDASLDLLMQMVQKVLDVQRESREDIREIKTRLGRLESDVASLHVFTCRTICPLRSLQ
jgi:hypothetical protein